MWISNKPPKVASAELKLNDYMNRNNYLEARCKSLEHEIKDIRDKYEGKTVLSGQDVAALVHAGVITTDKAREMLRL